ncbi:MAG TPA: gamma-glutamylcyclotransferase family protein [Hanamia sp.]
MESSKSDYLFVYSSLLKGFRSPEYDYISRYFSFVGKAKVKGILSDLDGIPVATPCSEDCFLNGELYQIKSADDFSFAIGQLDDYEGVGPEADEMQLYKRELSTVYREDKSVVDAWIYWYKGDVTGKPRITSGDVVEYIRSKGY